MPATLAADACFTGKACMAAAPSVATLGTEGNILFRLSRVTGAMQGEIKNVRVLNVLNPFFI